jgi:methylenetetrahydrofolate/methylenetetrahydromethanopterin dehydrogenase (NADP+)
MSKPKTLLQFDPDSLPSSFDAIVAIDAGIDFLLPYGAVAVKDVERLVHGCIFTRGPQDLANTAIFIGGTDVRVGEEIAARVKSTFFGPMRVSVMLDSNGCNSTAAAAVISAAQHHPLPQSRCLVLGATGSVGRRVCQLLARRGAHVTLASRSLDRAQAACKELESMGVPAGNVSPLEMIAERVAKSLAQSDIVFGCGAAGAELASADAINSATNLKVAVDLNAVAPTGLGGVEIQDKAKSRNGRIDYGALGVGGLKMKIHKSAIQQLFSRNDLFLDAEQMMEIGENLVKAASTK